MLNLLKVEFRKLGWRTLGSLVAITLVFNTSFAVIVIFLNNQDLNPQNLDTAVAPIQSLYVAYTTFNLLGVFLATGVMSAVLIASEYTGRTVSLVIASHGQRTEFVLAKYFVVFILAAAAPLLTTVIGFFVSAFLFAGSSEPQPFANVNWGGDIINAIAFFIRALLGIALYASVAVLLAFTSKSLVVTLGGMVILFLVSLLGASIFTTAEAMRFATLLPGGWINAWLGTGSEFGVNLSRLASVRVFELREILFGLLILFVTVTIVLITVAVFTRRDIKEG